MDGAEEGGRVDNACTWMDGWKSISYVSRTYFPSYLELVHCYTVHWYTATHHGSTLFMVNMVFIVNAALLYAQDVMCSLQPAAPAGKTDV